MNPRSVGPHHPPAKDTAHRAPLPAAPTTKEVIDHHLKSFWEGDLEGILSDYAPGAVLFTPEGPIRGIDAIRPLFRAMLEEFGKPGAAFNLKLQSVDADHGYILWTAETADRVYELGTDTFVVRDGKIVAQSYTGKVAPRHRTQS
jgi:ketosteroid isomerase-like protein